MIVVAEAHSGPPAEARGPRVHGAMLQDDLHVGGRALSGGGVAGRGSAGERPSALIPSARRRPQRLRSEKCT